jgi:homogentisate 1,2-dioxygenase
MHYYKLGKIPEKRHIQFRKPDGTLYHEELFSTEGFSSIYSILYHVNPPTQILQVGDPFSVAPKTIHQKQMKHRCLLGAQIPAINDYIESRKPVLVNDSCKIILSAPKESMTEYFYQNADADEMIFVHEGSGKLETLYGNLTFGPGDYLIIPRGTVYQFHFDGEKNRLLIVESSTPILTPNRYRNEFGQLLEHSPFCERDIRKPDILETHEEKGEFLLYIKKEDFMYPYTYESHPFDVVGWDGYLYPYAFNIKDFEPITGRIHQPPPVHQTFQSDAFVICSFVPRLYDYHPESIPAPYYHSNIDSDEVLYYVAGEFMSRKHVESAMLTLHPAGIPHGPQPGMIEKSIGQKETKELAVMIDTFAPLVLTEYAAEIEREDYYLSWLEK